MKKSLQSDPTAFVKKKKKKWPYGVFPSLPYYRGSSFNFRIPEEIICEIRKRRIDWPSDQREREREYVPEGCSCKSRCSSAGWDGIGRSHGCKNELEAREEVRNRGGGGWEPGRWLGEEEDGRPWAHQCPSPTPTPTHSSLVKVKQNFNKKLSFVYDNTCLLSYMSRYIWWFVSLKKSNTVIGTLHLFERGVFKGTWDILNLGRLRYNVNKFYYILQEHSRTTFYTSSQRNIIMVLIVYLKILFYFIFFKKLPQYFFKKISYLNTFPTWHVRLQLIFATIWLPVASLTVSADGSEGVPNCTIEQVFLRDVA